MRELMTTTEAAELLGVSGRQVRRLAHERRLSLARFGPWLVLDRAEVEALAAERRSNPPRRGRPRREAIAA